MKDCVQKSAIVIGAGPAGLTAADELCRSGRTVAVIEQDPYNVGGLARTESYKGYRFDLGAHRFYSKNSEIRRWWSERLGSDFIEVERLTRILYRGRYFHYPLRPANVLCQLGPMEAARCICSYLRSKLAPIRDEISFEDWVRNRFGTRLFQIFFKSYTEKVWGMPCDAISVDWASQRIRGLSLARAVLGGLGLGPKSSSAKTLVDRFHFPRRGSGMMWESARDALVRSGAQLNMGHRVTRVRRADGRICEIETVDQHGGLSTFSADDYVSSMPLSDLAKVIDPPLPDVVRKAAEALKYRDLIIVLLIVNRRDVFPDHWIYIHDPSVLVGRIVNSGNWSCEMTPDPDTTALVLDYFCNEGDSLSTRTNAELLSLARSEIDSLGVASSDSVIDGHVVRVPRAYPVFDCDYKAHVATIRAELERIPNLHFAGRNGMHKYNNQDHSMLTGIIAARAANGEPVSPWKVNIDAEYLEEESGIADSARLLPKPIPLVHSKV